MSRSKSIRRTVWTDADDAILSGVLTVLDKNDAQIWSGTMTELRMALVRVLGKKRSTWLPGSPGALRVALNRVVNRLRSRKVSVRFIRTPDHARTRVVKFSR